MAPITVLVAGTANSGPAPIGKVASAAASTAEPGRLVIASVAAPMARAPLTEATRSSLAPDCEMVSAAMSRICTPAPSEKTDGGIDVQGRPSSRMIVGQMLAAASDDPRAMVKNPRFDLRSSGAIRSR